MPMYEPQLFLLYFVLTNGLHVVVECPGNCVGNFFINLCCPLLFMMVRIRRINFVPCSLFQKRNVLEDGVEDFIIKGCMRRYVW